MIYLRNTTRKHRFDLRRVERVACELLAAVRRPEASLSLTFVGDAAMRRLNEKHRDKGRPTDVLSFPLYEPFAVPKRARAHESEVLLGDIVIDVDAAVRQAAAYEASLDDEIERLLVHAIAHLLGHDHEEPRERARMLREERRLAAAIGLAWPYDAPKPGGGSRAEREGPRCDAPCAPAAEREANPR